MKKKFFIVLGILLIFSGLRLLDNGLLSIRQKGTFTAYGKNGSETVFNENNKPKLDRFGGYSRLDVEGDIEKAKAGLKDINAKILWTEQIEEITIIYAYSFYISRYETVKGKRVNVMTAVRNGLVSYGCPLLKGSY